MDTEPTYNVFINQTIINEIESNREYVLQMIHAYMKKTLGADLISREVAYELYHKHLVDK